MDGSDGVTSDGLISDSVISDGVISDGLISDGVISDGVTSDGLISDSVISDGVTSDSVISDSVISDGITSFQAPYPASIIESPPETDLSGIWGTLQDVIEKEVKKAKIRKDALEIIPDWTYTEEDFRNTAVSTIYHDVAEFYGWYFNPDDLRTIWVGDKAVHNETLDGDKIPYSLDIDPVVRKAVAPVVASNLEAMREVDEIPDGQDSENLEKIVTDNLSRYISNWESWFYDRWELEQIEDYDEQRSVYNDIYLDEGWDGTDPYGTLGNVYYETLSEDEPIELGADEPIELGVDEPIEPGADESIEPGADEPIELGADEPIEPGADEPIELGADEPIELGADEPIELGVQHRPGV